MTSDRMLIVNADDFGYATWVDQGVLTSHIEGIVTSASLMVRQASSASAAASARDHPRLDLGLHLDLGEWAFRDGAWVLLYQVVDLDDVEAVSAEIRSQVQLFRSLVDRAPTHLDSHQHVHRRSPLRTIISRLAAELGIPLREVTPGIGYCGTFYGQMEDGGRLPDFISADALIKIVADIPAGVTELSCHPGMGDDPEAATSLTMYRVERAVEVSVLTDPRVAEAITDLGVRLATFPDAAAAVGVRA